MSRIKISTYLIGAIILAIATLPTAVTAQADTSTEAMIRVINAGDVDLLSRLVDRGADVNQANKNGFTPLMAAARTGHTAITAMLLDKGAKINAQNNAGATALMIAAKYGHNHIVTKLVKEGANPTITNNHGNTARSFASIYHHLEISRLLATAERDFERS